MTKTTKKTLPIDINEEEVSNAFTDFEKMSAEDQHEVKQKLILDTPLGRAIDSLYGLASKIGAFVIEGAEHDRTITSDEAFSIMATTGLSIGKHADAILESSTGFLTFVTSTAFRYISNPESFSPEEKAALDKVVELLEKEHHCKESDSIKHEGNEMIH